MQNGKERVSKIYVITWSILLCINWCGLGPYRGHHCSAIEPGRCEARGHRNTVLAAWRHSKESCSKRSDTSTQVLSVPSFKVPFDPGRAKTGDTSHLQRLNSINCNSANYVDQEAMPMLAPPVKDNTFIKCGQGGKCSHILKRWNWRSNIIICKAAPTSYRAQRARVTVVMSYWVGAVPRPLLGGSRSVALNYSISWREIKINISVACPE
jgi:hypothetical protein